jgi:hypothetical protein
MTLDQIGKLQQQRLALIRLELAPRPFERLARRGDGPIDVLRVALGHGGEEFAGRWVAALEGLARRGVDPLAVDEHLFHGAVCKRMTADRNRLGLGHGVSSIAVTTRVAAAKISRRTNRRYIYKNTTTMNEKRQKAKPAYRGNPTANTRCHLPCGRQHRPVRTLRPSGASAMPSFRCRAPRRLRQGGFFPILCCAEAGYASGTGPHQPGRWLASTLLASWSAFSIALAKSFSTSLRFTRRRR